MSSIVVELTNHCNMKCKHCFNERHNGDGFLSLKTVKTVLNNAKKSGVTEISFTGGEPTLHPDISKIIEMTTANGYECGIVTNAWNFKHIYDRSFQELSKIGIITFSLDGAKDCTHDDLRRAGSFRRVLQAMSICVVKNIPFSVNSVVTAHNYKEIEDIVNLAHQLGSRGVRFGFLMPTEISLSEKLVLSQNKLKDIQGEVFEIQKNSKMPVVLAPGFFNKSLFPCAPLRLKEFSIDWKGRVSFCCHISEYQKLSFIKDMIGNLNEYSFSIVHRRFKNLIHQFRKYKNNHYKKIQFKDKDYFPCLYCLKYFENAAERFLN